MPPDDRTEKLRATCRAKLEALLAEAEAQFALVKQLLEPIEKERDDWMRLYNRFEIASAQFPFAPYHRYYFHNLAQPIEPLFGGIMDELSDKYVEITDAEIEQVRERWLKPVAEAVKATFDNAKKLFVRVAAEVIVVRRLSGYEDLLTKLGETITPPWADAVDTRYRNYGRRFPYWVATMTQVTPFHREVGALREANQGTLRKTHDKLQGLMSILRAMIDELEFADMLSQPVAVPQTLVLMQKIDNSTTVGDGATVRDSAVGKESQRQGR